MMLSEASGGNLDKEGEDEVNMEVEEKLLAEEKEERKSTPKIFDAHFHLDRTFKRLRKDNIMYNKDNELSFNLSALLKESGHEEPVITELQGGVASFCDEDTINRIANSPEIREHLDSQSNCWYAFGVHPSCAEDLLKKGSARAETLVSKVTTLLEMSKTVALGEIGLDFSRPNTQKLLAVDDFSEQKQLLRLMLTKAKVALDKGLPVVVHTREAGSAAAASVAKGMSASEETVKILQEVLGPNHKVYVHCFQGGEREVQLWTDAFPQVVFGAVGDLRSWKLEVITNLFHRNKILMETDAPYFSTHSSGFSTPYQVTNVLNRVTSRLASFMIKEEGRVRKLRLSEVASKIAATTRSFFKI